MYLLSGQNQVASNKTMCHKCILHKLIKFFLNSQKTLFHRVIDCKRKGRFDIFQTVGMCRVRKKTNIISHTYEYLGEILITNF